MTGAGSGRILKIGIWVLLVAGVGTTIAKTLGTSVIALPPPPPAQGQVAAIVAGDSFDVRSDDQITRVRLGFVATPAPDRPGQPPTCLAAEAVARLSSIIPVGTGLTLTYDKDRFGRTVAQVQTPDRRLVNAEIARSGLAHVVIDPGTTVPPQVTAAAQEALTTQRGVHSDTIACTVPGQVKALTNAVASLPAGPHPDEAVADLASSANRATDARMAAEELDSAFSQNRQDITWIALDPQERARLQAQVRTAINRAEADETALRSATNVTVNEVATQTSAQKEAARVAKRLADIRRAEAARAAEAARREAAARRAEAAAQAEAQTRAEAQRGSQSESSKPSSTAEPSPSSDSGSATKDRSSDTPASRSSKKRSSDSNGG